MKLPRIPRQGRGTKRVVVIADPHCGHRAGLTPPRWRFRECSTEHVWQKFTKVQEEAWNLYAAEIERLKPIDCLILNGDAIDGRGEKSGGVELITGDRNEQVKMAVDCITPWEAPHVVITRGTPYHTGEIESWEDLVAEQVRAKVGDHEWVEVNGFVFDCKHHVGASSVPHGRMTAISREVLWNRIWAEAGDQPRADIVVRSHVHYYRYGEDDDGGRVVRCVITPALQAMGTRYGARQCSGTVSWGLLAWDIDVKGSVCLFYRGLHQLRSTSAKVYRA